MHALTKLNPQMTKILFSMPQSVVVRVFVLHECESKKQSAHSAHELSPGSGVFVCVYTHIVRTHTNTIYIQTHAPHTHIHTHTQNIHIHIYASIQTHAHARAHTRTKDTYRCSTHRHTKDTYAYLHICTNTLLTQGWRGGGGGGGGESPTPTQTYRKTKHR